MSNSFVGAALSALVLVGQASAQTCTGQVGWWRFDGDTLDSSGLNNDAVFFGSTPNYVAGVSGQALRLDGFSDFVRVANSASLNPSGALTLAGWANIRSYSGSGNDPVIDKGYFGHSYPYYQYHLGVTGDLYPHERAGFSFNAAAGGIPYSAGTPGNFYTPGAWYFIVGTYDGSNARFYANGELVSENPAAGTIADYGQPVQFGKFDNLNFYLPATLDEIRIFSRAISHDEVRALYSNPAGAAAVWPPTSGVCAGGAATFHALHLADPSATYAWTLDGAAVSDGARPDGVVVSGSATAHLTLGNLTGAPTRTVSATVTFCNGTVAATPATVKVCAADFNCDAQVDDADFVIFAGAYNDLTIPPANPICDLNGDGLVEDSDFVIFVAAYNDLLCP